MKEIHGRPVFPQQALANNGPIIKANIIERAIRKKFPKVSDRHELMNANPELLIDMVKEVIGEDHDLLEDFATVMLEVNTEKFGNLDTLASKQLMLAKRGTYRQIIEEEKAKTKNAVKLENPADRLVRLPLDIGIPGSEIPEFKRLPEYTRPVFERLLQGIGDYPLYLQAVEKVLPPESYAVYLTAQQERESFQIEAKRQTALANLDLHLLLSREQREHAEVWLAQSDAEISVSELYLQLIKALDQELLTDWQQTQCLFYIRVLGQEN